MTEGNQRGPIVPPNSDQRLPTSRTVLPTFRHSTFLRRNRVVNALGQILEDSIPRIGRSLLPRVIHENLVEQHHAECVLFTILQQRLARRISVDT